MVWCSAHDVKDLGEAGWLVQLKPNILKVFAGLAVPEWIEELD
jgi:hypothetical protein